MKKTMTNAEMVTAVNRIIGMQNREEQQGTKLFSDKVKINYAIKKNKDKLMNLLKPYDESREELYRVCKTNEPDEEGKVKIRKDCAEKWSDGLKELQEIEAEVDVHMIRFADIEKLPLSMNDLEAIDFMLEAPEGFVE